MDSFFFSILKSESVCLQEIRGRRSRHLKRRSRTLIQNLHAGTHLISKPQSCKQENMSRKTSLTLDEKKLTNEYRRWTKRVGDVSSSGSCSPVTQGYEFHRCLGTVRMQYFGNASLEPPLSYSLTGDRLSTQPWESRRRGRVRTSQGLAYAANPAVWEAEARES